MTSHLPGKWAWLALAAVSLAIVGAAWGTLITRWAAIDFFSFWTASKLVLTGNAGAAYAFQPSPIGELMPLAYPPPFLLLIAPLALVPLAPSFLIWVAATGLLYLLASRAPKWVALGNPSAAANGMIGQNGFLTAAILLFGLHTLTKRPVLGGAILGLMIIKPQLALLLPVAVVAGRLWTAIPSAIASAAALLLLAWLLFGAEVYRGFLEILPFYQGRLVAGRWHWNELASIFAFVRWFGGSDGLAWGVHGLAVLVAATLTWQAWSRDWECKVPLIASGSLLISPYLFTYDAVLLVAPLAWLAKHRPLWAILLAILSAMPLLRSFGLYGGPSATPVVAALCMTVLGILGPSNSAPRRIETPQPA